MKAFLSYHHSEREVAGRVADRLTSIGIEPFCAHDSIEVSEDWRTLILQELKVFDVFVWLVSEASSTSAWCLQESGFALSRLPNVTLFSLLLDATAPPAFHSKWQGVRISPDTQPAAEIFLPRLVDSLPRKILPAMIERLGMVVSFTDADSAMMRLRPYIDRLTPDEAQQILRVSCENGQVWGAAHYRGVGFFPRLLEHHEDYLDGDLVRHLNYRLEHGTLTPEEQEEQNARARAMMLTAQEAKQSQKG